MWFVSALPHWPPTSLPITSRGNARNQSPTGFSQVAVESMANAIRKITIERGDDVRDFVLCSFGGAAGQHACKVAEVLDMKKVWLHPMAGVLSAYGMGLSDIRVEKQQSADVPFNDVELAEDSPTD